ncbi:MAG TPA: metalloregulator ArsR/SmtB family transcription factor [Candidatus Saccharibacteria bacterium]|nr:metalloregulator ArsR/SmtB family transcription factor [Candidatus Saccharibacteria bacterium]HRK94545.1 metalloregulator ArsR/SmtB family transcription factor [Candidatus Saccharibacteria bacterium]
MVEYAMRIDNIFAALADPIRRDILERVSDVELTVNQIALDYDISLAAISKHLKVLLEAGLIRKRKEGRYNYVTTKPEGMREAAAYIKQYEELWGERLDALDNYLKEG